MQLGRMLIAEAIGTYLLVLFGAGAVATDVVTGGQLGLWPVGFIGGFGVTIGIYATVAISGAHLNPAISLAFASSAAASSLSAGCSPTGARSWQELSSPG